MKASTSAADAKEADIKKMEEAVGKHRCAPAHSNWLFRECMSYCVSVVDNVRQ